MTAIQDDRTREQKETHRYIWLGTDPFMSGWGGAAGGASYAGWACRPEHSKDVESWVRNRGDMRRIRLALNDYRPGGGCAHLHIYVVEAGHPSISKVRCPA